MTSCGGGGGAVFSELIVQTGGNRLIAPQSMLLILSKIDHQTYFTPITENCSFYCWSSRKTFADLVEQIQMQNILSKYIFFSQALDHNLQI